MASLGHEIEKLASMLTNVATSLRIMRHRMTYIPALLFGGLLCMLLVAFLVAALIVYTSRSATAKQSRTVDTSHLLMDVTANIRSRAFVKSRHQSNEELER